MAQTFFFYDLETSGLNPREDRIMQFAGQRTDMNLQPVGEPFNILVRLNDDTLPSPDALMVTGITPQKTIEEGYTEAEFAEILLNDVFTPDTIAVGFNNVRFDDEFVRYLFWRNFRDPYEWCWKDGRSRWDLLDVIRMTRALRPEGIEWPVDAEGKPTNRLELLTKANGIAHESAHDALSDVEALIEVTRLIKTKQPQLYDYLLKMRDKKAVMKLVNVDDKQPFVYASGRFENEWNKLSIALPLAPAPNNNVLVYDLRYDPQGFVDMSEKELAEKIFASWEERKKDTFVTLPVKVMQYNRCPAVAPLGVLEAADGWQKIGLDKTLVAERMKVLLQHPGFAERLRTLYERKRDFAKSIDAEGQLYDGFLPDGDRVRVDAVRNVDVQKLADFHPEFSDERLAPLLLHYKARNFPKSLSDSELALWEEWRSARLQSQLPGFMAALARVSKQATDAQQYVIEEMQLWAESILPGDIE